MRAAILFVFALGGILEFGLILRKLSAAILLASMSLAAAADSSFDRGVAAFKQQQYQSAIALFEQARNEGNESAILSFNLASSYFKLDQYREAKRYYLLAVQDEMLAGLSYYNVGLIALKENDQSAAFDAFRNSFELAQDEKLKYLAAVKLDELAPERAEKSFSDRVYGFASLSFAHDDNVAHVNDLITTVTGKSDNYLDLFGVATYQLSGNYQDGVQLKAGLILTRYDDMKSFNENVINVGAYLNKPLADWKSRFGLVYYHNKIDGASFQQRLSLLARADHYYARGQRLRFRYQFTHHDDLATRFSYLNGWRQRLSVENRSRINNHKLRLGYRFEINDRENFQTTSSFISYSPLRHALYGWYEYEFSQRWLAKVMAEYRNSDYQYANIIRGVDEGIRKDDLSRFQLSGIYRFNRDTELELSWRNTDNRSTVASESYVSNVYMLSVNYFF